MGWGGLDLTLDEESKAAARWPVPTYRGMIMPMLRAKPVGFAPSSISFSGKSCASYCFLAIWRVFCGFAPQFLCVHTCVALRPLNVRRPFSWTGMGGGREST